MSAGPPTMRARAGGRGGRRRARACACMRRSAPTAAPRARSRPRRSNKHTEKCRGYAVGELLGRMGGLEDDVKRMLDALRAAQQQGCAATCVRGWGALRDAARVQRLAPAASPHLASHTSPNYTTLHHARSALYWTPELRDTLDIDSPDLARALARREGWETLGGFERVGAPRDLLQRWLRGDPVRAARRGARAAGARARPCCGGLAPRAAACGRGRAKLPAQPPPPPPPAPPGVGLARGGGARAVPRGHRGRRRRAAAVVPARARVRGGGGGGAGGRAATDTYHLPQAGVPGARRGLTSRRWGRARGGCWRQVCDAGGV